MDGRANLLKELEEASKEIQRLRSTVRELKSELRHLKRKRTNDLKTWYNSYLFANARKAVLEPLPPEYSNADRKRIRIRRSTATFDDPGRSRAQVLGRGKYWSNARSGHGGG